MHLSNDVQCDGTELRLHWNFRLPIGHTPQLLHKLVHALVEEWNETPQVTKTIRSDIMQCLEFIHDPGYFALL